jgi:hypothetical protein
VLACAFTCFYFTLGGILWKNYGVLPTIALGAGINNHGLISLYFFVFYALVLGLVFVLIMNKIRLIRQEFSMITELQIFTAIQLICINLVLFLLIQGKHSSWFIETTSLRTATWILILRSVLACFLTISWPLLATRKSDDPNETLFFPIPPNRQCIEEVDMLLHIPVAVDYFYDYLESRRSSSKD